MFDIIFHAPKLAKVIHLGSPKLLAKCALWQYIYHLAEGEPVLCKDHNAFHNQFGATWRRQHPQSALRMRLQFICAAQKIVKNDICGR